MNKDSTLNKLESMLESFLEVVVAQNEEKIEVQGAISRLDDIAHGIQEGNDLTADMGEWFARHNHWLGTELLKKEERSRIDEIFKEIRRELRVSEDSSPAIGKIASEIDRWQNVSRQGGHKVVLKRGPEIAPLPRTSEDLDVTVGLFQNQMERLGSLFASAAGRKQHLLSVLDDTLNSASIQKNKDALILSALIIYCLKQSGYLVKPYIERLREAEELQKGAPSRA